MSDVHVRLKTRDLDLEFRCSLASYERVFGPLLQPFAGRRRTQPAARPVPPGPIPPPPPTYVPPSDRFSLFQRQLDPEDEGVASRIAAYAFFLWNYEKKEVFREEEIEGCFQAEGADPPPAEANANAYGDLLSRRMLAPAPQDHTWRLTGKGRDYVRHHVLSA